MTIERFLLARFIKPPEECGCGFKHEYPLKAALFGRMEECLEVLDEYEIRPPYGVFYDPITYEIAGMDVLKILGAKGFVVSSPTYDDAQSKLKKVKELNLGTVIAVGGGSVIDVTRYVAYEGNLNFVAIPTAPSNDGIASPRAALYHVSQTGELVYTGTAPAKPPTLVIFDMSIISSAPKKLISSGYGDILSKLVSIKDWQLARDDLGERYCKNAEELALAALNTIIETAKDRKEFDSLNSVKSLCKALILSGAAMGIVGSTRPAGGSEHMVARHLEIGFKRKIPHGVAVAIGTLAMGAFHELKNPNWWKEDDYSVESMKKYLEKWKIPSKLEQLNIPVDLMVEAITESWKSRPERYTILHKFKPCSEEAKEILERSGLI